MKVALSARIPANKVTCRKTGFKAHALSGKAVRAFDLLVFYEKSFYSCAPLGVGRVCFVCGHGLILFVGECR